MSIDSNLLTDKCTVKSSYRNLLTAGNVSILRVNQRNNFVKTESKISVKRVIRSV
jgi:hypothetical protein